MSAGVDSASEFAGRIAVVTGAGGGIGFAVAEALAARGATVALVELELDRARGAAQRLGETVAPTHAYAIDVADHDAVADGVARIAADCGGIDLLVNCAGVATVATLDEMAPEEWLRVIGVNLNGPFFCTRSVAPHMRDRGGGAIVNVSSVAGRWIAYYAGVHYAASKAGLLSLTRQSALELARWDIRVNAVCPGPMENRMGRDVPFADNRLDNLPLGRRVAPGEVADAVLFLCGDAARMVTGVDLPIDGGFLTSTMADLGTYFRVKGVELDRGGPGT